MRSLLRWLAGPDPALLEEMTKLRTRVGNQAKQIRDGYQDLEHVRRERDAIRHDLAESVLVQEELQASLDRARKEGAVWEERALERARLLAETDDEIRRLRQESAIEAVLLKAGDGR